MPTSTEPTDTIADLAAYLLSIDPRCGEPSPRREEPEVEEGDPFGIFDEGFDAALADHARNHGRPLRPAGPAEPGWCMVWYDSDGERRTARVTEVRP